MAEITPEKKQEIFKKALEKYAPKREPFQEKREQERIFQEEKEQLIQEIERQKEILSEEIETAAEKEAKKLRTKQTEEALDELLSLAAQKGLITAVTAAKKTKDPQLIDLFHDLLAQEGLFRTFLNK